MPVPSFLAGGTQVSASFGNGVSVSATPWGFVVLDVVAGTEIMRENTPAPVRAIATDQPNGVAYLTVPDNNLLLSVPVVQ